MSTKISEPLVLVTGSNGLVIIPENTPLKRLNYFDGKFLRASDLKDEQDYLRHLVWLSNQAGGSGVVHGFDLTLGGGDTLNLGPGLAINPDGRVLLLPQGLSLGIQDLIDKSQELQTSFPQGNAVATEDFHECDMASDGPVTTTNSNDLYLIVISPAEALCGVADVYGKLCEEACATSTDRPFALEGVIVRAIPLVLKTALPHSAIIPIATKAHLRSRVASAYFEDERKQVAAMISKFGLEQQVWCLGADAASGGGLPIGVIARAGPTTVFLDAWIARRERMDTPPRRYWQWRMMMRPWDVFLAQILQFQCQLRDLVGGVPIPGGEDPCGGARTVIVEAATKIAALVKAYKDLNVAGQTGNGFKAKIDELESMTAKLTSTEQQMTITGEDRLLIRRGMIEIPSAGYLPVVPDANLTINEQVVQLMGEGVDLRFCVVRPDFVAHALEEAQHLERISLIEGLEDADNKPQVDILVPDGELVAPTPQPTTLRGFEVDGQINSEIRFKGGVETADEKLPQVTLQGAARAESLPDVGTVLYVSCASQFPYVPALRAGVAKEKWLAEVAGATGFHPTNGPPPIGLWLSLKSDKNLFSLKKGDTFSVHAEAIVATGRPGGPNLLELSGELGGQFSVDQVGTNHVQSIQGIGNLTGKVFFPESGFQHESTREYQYKFEYASPSAFIFQFGADKMDVGLGQPSKSPVPHLDVILSMSKNVLFITTLDGSLTESSEVFSETNTNHGRALQALQTISSAMNEPAFVTDKTRLLFPEQPSQKSGEAAVRATRDWVMFHRRRDRTCHIEIPPAPQTPVKTVCHTVYRAKDKKQFAMAAETIEAFIETGAGDLGQLIKRTKLIKLGDVLFEEHSAKFAGDGKTIDDVVTAWNKDGGKATTAAVFAHTGTPSLTAQANAIVNKVNQGAGVVDSKAFTVPASIDLPTECPAFSILVAQEQPACISVYRTPDGVGFEEIRAMVQKLGSTGNFMNDVVGIKAFSPVGDVEFEANTTNDVDDTLKQMKAEWIKQKGGEVVAYLLVWHDSEEGSTLQKQAARIRDEIGTTATMAAFATPVSDDVTFPTACPAIMVVWETVPPRTGLLHVVTTNASGDRVKGTSVLPVDVAFGPSANLTTSLSDIVKILQTQKKIPIIRVELAPNSPETKNTANARLQSVVKKLNDAAAGTVAAGAANAVVTLKSAEQQTFNAGGKADDVIFLVAGNANKP